MGIPSMTIAGLRAIAQSIADECEHQIDELGPAGLEAVGTRVRCLTVVAVLDSEPERLTAIARLAFRLSPLDGLAMDRLAQAQVDGAVAVPERIKGAIDRYVSAGLRPGDCVYAVLSNDMRVAFARADAEVVAAMPAILRYLNACVPCACWGSPEAVAAWIAKCRA